MVITDTLGHFGDKLARFPAYSEFACVVYSLSREGSAFIKRLESPRHDSLSAERLPDAEARDRARMAMKAFSKEIRRIIRNYSLPVFENEEAAHEMSDLFQNNSGDPADSKPSDNRNPEAVRTILKHRKPKPPPAEYSDADGDETGDEVGPNPAPQPRPPGPDPGPPVPNPSLPGGGPRKAVRLADLRNRMPDPAKPEVRELFFTPSDSGEATVAVRAAGLFEQASLRIVAASGAAVKDGRIRLPLSNGRRHRVVVTLEEPFTGPIEIAGFIVTRGAVE